MRQALCQRLDQPVEARGALDLVTGWRGGAINGHQIAIFERVFWVIAAL